jgi:hypothetical protein
MAPGAQIIVGSGYTLTINSSLNTSVEAACDIMWKGILVKDEGKIQISNIRFRDAQYAVTFEDDAQYTFQNVIFERNWVDIYCPEIYPNDHILNNLNTIVPQSFISIGTQIQGIPQVKLLPPFPGQSPIPNGNSYAAILIYDVVDDAFSFFNSNSNNPGVILSSNQFGIKDKNCNIDLTGFGIFAMRNLITTDKPFYGGNGIYAEARTSTLPRQLTINPLGIYRPGFDGCDRSIYLINYMDCDFNYNQPTPYITDVNFYASCKNRTLSLTDCEFHNANYGIWVNDVQGGALNLTDNRFYDPIPYPGTNWVGNFRNTAMLLKGNPNFVATVNLHIANNTFNLMRIGMYLFNFDGVPGSEVKDNHYLINHNVYLPGMPLYHQPHYGYWMEKCNNLTFTSNEAVNMDPAPPLNFLQYATDAIAFNIKTSGSNISTGLLNIVSSNIDRMGTAFRFVDHCEDVYLYCNGMNDCHRGPFYDLASGGAYGSSQGYPDPFGNGLANHNEWQNWTAPNRVEGTLNTNNGTMLWTYDLANAALEQEHPYNVTPSLQFSDLGITPNVFPNCIVPPPASSPEQRIANIINENVQYEVYPDESSERDKEDVYFILKNNTTLRNSNIDFINFYNSKAGGNYDKFNEVENLLTANDYTSALNLLNDITPDNILEENKKFALNIGIQAEQDPDYIISENDRNVLTDLAWTPVWQGGVAVFIARSILNLEVNDYANGLRKADTDKPSKNIFVNPNPAHEYLLINLQDKTVEYYIIKDITGRPVMEKSTKSIANIATLRNGIYIVEVYKNGSKINTTKIVKQ